MSEKVVNLKFKSLKDRAQVAGEKASTTAIEKFTATRNLIKERASERRRQVVGTIIDKGINLTEKQLNSLKKLQKQEKKKRG
ncbi:hypothetical protein [Pseudobacteriovorax antillogorgiicola]|nr:hypothetical protein [Pseudobacteriovorax antillogorgiicola]